MALSDVTQQMSEYSDSNFSGEEPVHLDVAYDLNVKTKISNIEQEVDEIYSSIFDLRKFFSSSFENVLNEIKTVEGTLKHDEEVYFKTNYDVNLKDQFGAIEKTQENLYKNLHEDHNSLHNDHVKILTAVELVGAKLSTIGTGGGGTGGGSTGGGGTGGGGTGGGGAGGGGTGGGGTGGGRQRPGGSGRSPRLPRRGSPFMSFSNGSSGGNLNRTSSQVQQAATTVQNSLQNLTSAFKNIIPTINNTLIQSIKSFGTNSILKKIFSSALMDFVLGALGVAFPAVGTIIGTGTLAYSLYDAFSDKPSPIKDPEKVGGEISPPDENDQSQGKSESGFVDSITSFFDNPSTEHIASPAVPIPRDSGKTAEKYDAMAGATPTGEEILPQKTAHIKKGDKKYNSSMKKKIDVAMDFFTNQGWTQDQAIDLVSNLMRESTLKENAFSKDVKKDGSIQTNKGIAQWDEHRVKTFEKLFNKKFNESTYFEQLQYFNWELTGKLDNKPTEMKSGFIKAGEHFKSAKTPEERSKIIIKEHEKSRAQAEDIDKNLTNRNKLLQSLEKYDQIVSDEELKKEAETEKLNKEASDEIKSLNEEDPIQRRKDIEDTRKTAHENKIKKSKKDPSLLLERYNKDLLTPLLNKSMEDLEKLKSYAPEPNIAPEKLNEKISDISKSTQPPIVIMQGSQGEKTPPVVLPSPPPPSAPTKTSGIPSVRNEESTFMKILFQDYQSITNGYA